MKNNLPIENQVCSLEQAKELAELLGEDAPKSVWVYVKEGKDGWNAQPRQLRPILPKGWRQIAAYTGDELGSLLPDYIEAKEEKWIRHQSFSGDNTIAYYGEYKVLFGSDYFKYEAQAKAALAIKGLKEGWIKKGDFRYGKG